MKDRMSLMQCANCKKLNEVEKMVLVCEECSFDGMLMDVLFAACGRTDGVDIIDNMCLSSYEDACKYLERKGWLKSKNGRIYYVVKI